MLRPEEVKETFAGFAMELLNEAGHADASVPVFANHTPEQFVFFDSEKSIALSTEQREMLEEIESVSYLFSLDDDFFECDDQQIVSYYSAELICSYSSRSQIAHDAHMMLHPFTDAQVSIMLFKHDEEFMLSIAGYGEDAILSDWYSFDLGYDEFIEKIDIVNISIKTAKEFYDGLIYCAAREYYIHPVSKEMAMYSALPVNYFSTADYGYLDREEMQRKINDASNVYVHQYGSDYVEREQKEHAVDQELSVSAELDLILLDMDEDGEKDDAPFGEEVDSHDDEIETDKYEFDDLAPELFEDPTLLVKWLEKRNVDGTALEVQDEIDE